jgi:hypothetical protein
MTHPSDLIVPIKDRRQRKRYLTLKNVRNVAIVALVLFVGITIRSELRDRGPADYGRLYGRTLPAVEQRPVEVVREDAPPVDDAAHADPMLVEPMVREQWLTADSEPLATELPIDMATPVAVDTAQRAVVSVQSGDTRVAIVGGTEGVAVVKKAGVKPVLAGGFGRN